MHRIEYNLLTGLLMQIKQKMYKTIEGSAILLDSNETPTPDMLEIQEDEFVIITKQQG